MTNIFLKSKVFYMLIIVGILERICFVKMSRNYDGNP